MYYSPDTQTSIIQSFSHLIVPKCPENLDYLTSPTYSFLWKCCLGSCQLFSSATTKYHTPSLCQECYVISQGQRGMTKQNKTVISCPVKIKCDAGNIKSTKLQIDLSLDAQWFKAAGRVPPFTSSHVTAPFLRITMDELE